MNMTATAMPTEGRISRQGLFPIDRVDGARTFATAPDVFHHVDTNFRLWGLFTRSTATMETHGRVFQLNARAALREAFKKVSEDLMSLAFTQSQIVWICENRSELLAENGAATFFLFESYGRLFVAYVTKVADGTRWLHAARLTTSEPEMWDGDKGHRIITRCDL